MKALDTNVLARFFIDDPSDDETVKQRPAAIAALEVRAFVGVTVLLEFEWVMRGFYKLSRADIIRVLTALIGLEHMTIEDRPAVLNALDAYAGGLDFADALHLARSGRAASFATFDQRFAKKAKRLGVTPPMEVLS